MKTSDQVSMCLGNLLRRKMRTFLTIVGVIVGTAAIVVMISLGLGMNLQMDATIARMGSRLTTIRVMSYNYNGQENQAALDDKTIAQIQAMEGVEVATPIYQPNISGSIYTGRDDRSRMQLWDIQGMYAEAMPKMGYTLLEGEYPKGPQKDKKKPIYIVVGENASYAFEDTKKKFDNYRWPEMDENGKIIKLPFADIMKSDLFLKTDKKDEDDPESTRITREIKVVGRMKEDWDKGYETSQGILMDVEDIKWLEQEYNRVNKIKTDSKTSKNYNQVTVKVGKMEDVAKVEEQIKALGFETSSAESDRKTMQDQARQQQLFLGLMGGISLVVAAIGITNTMIMSIYERTREIGVMKVLGCHVRNIRTIFLMEAGVIGFAGGCLGVGISYAASYFMNAFNFTLNGGGNMGGGRYGGGMMMGGMGSMGDAAQIPVSVIPLWLVVAAIAFATLVGLLSGVLPANRAMKISALEAIKHE